MTFDPARAAEAGDLAAVWPWVGRDAPRGVGEDQVVALESRLGLSLPDDFRDYLRFWSPPSDTEETDEDVTTWWALDRMATLSEGYEHPVKLPSVQEAANDYLLFADGCFWCWAWALCCGEGPDRGRVVLIDGKDRFVADSFSDFMRIYLKDPKRLSPGG